MVSCIPYFGFSWPFLGYQCFPRPCGALATWWLPGSRGFSLFLGSLASCLTLGFRRISLFCWQPFTTAFSSVYSAHILTALTKKPKQIHQRSRTKRRGASSTLQPRTRLSCRMGDSSVRFWCGPLLHTSDISNTASHSQAARYLPVYHGASAHHQVWCHLLEDQDFGTLLHLSS